MAYVLKVSSKETHHLGESRNRSQGSQCFHPLAATPRRITQLCTCLLRSKTTWAASETLAQLISSEVRLCLGSQQPHAEPA